MGFHFFLSIVFFFFFSSHVFRSHNKQSYQIYITQYFLDLDSMVHFTKTMQTDKKSQENKEENNYFWHLGFSSSIYARARAVNLNSTACGKHFPFSILSFFLCISIFSLFVFFLFLFLFCRIENSRHFSVFIVSHSGEINL